MKYLHKYDTKAAHDAVYNGSDYQEPWVAYIDATDEVTYNKNILYTITNDTSVELYYTNGTITPQNSIMVEKGDSFEAYLQHYSQADGGFNVQVIMGNEDVSDLVITDSETAPSMQSSSKTPSLRAPSSLIYSIISIPNITDNVIIKALHIGHSG